MRKRRVGHGRGHGYTDRGDPFVRLLVDNHDIRQADRSRRVAYPDVPAVWVVHLVPLHHLVPIVSPRANKRVAEFALCLFGRDALETHHLAAVDADASAQLALGPAAHDVALAKSLVRAGA